MEIYLCAFLIFFIPFWLFQAHTAAQISNLKGNGFWISFLGALILGPLQLYLSAAAPMTITQRRLLERQWEEERVRAGALQWCPACLSAIDPRARACRFCGRDLSPMPAREALPAAVSIPPIAEPRLCRACGASNAPDLKFCTRCGTYL